MGFLSDQIKKWQKPQAPDQSTAKRSLVLEASLAGLSDAPKTTQALPCEPGTFASEFEASEGEFLVIGKTLYQLTPLAQGGKSCVYKAMPTCRQHEPVSVKVISPEWESNESVKRQLSLEATILRSLEHPKLPRFVGRGLFSGRMFLAYHYILGKPLMTLFREQWFSNLPREKRLESTVNIGYQIAEQLHYIHTKMVAVVHGDVSAENIIITPDLKAHLVDFSASHLRNTPTAISYRWIAKPSYLTPEQARGDSWSWQSDLYQLGILLFEMLEGQRWIRGSTAREKMLFAASVAKPDDDFLISSAGEELSQLTAQLLEPDPAKRRLTAADCMRRLKHLLY